LERVRLPTSRHPESPIGPGVAIRENVSGAVVGDRVKNISVKR